MESGSLFNLDNLTRVPSRGGVDMRPTLLRVLTDLYVQKLAHTPDEERHYTELALRLLDAVDVTTRTAVAARLSRHLSPPVQVIRRLAADLPAVAEPLRAHPLLQRGAKSEPPAPAKVPAVAMAETPISAPPTAATLHAEEIDQAKAPHPAADLNAPIGADVAVTLNELFFAADASERRLIVLNLEVVAPLPSGHARLSGDPVVIQRLEKAALSGNREEFAKQLAQALQVPHTQAHRIAADELGEPLLIAAKALAMPRDVLYRLLLFVNTAIGHSVERVGTLATLYDEMTTQAAVHMVAIWQAMQQGARSAAQHSPLLYNDEPRARARTTVATVRRAPAAQRPNTRRDVS
jgi:uncharacterized protein (DUF2336 family)